MKKTGQEKFTHKEDATNVSLLEFWQWSQSDLLNNTLRGTIAEFIVAKAVNATNAIRVEWDAYDLITPQGLKIEVKSAAYLQSWKQERDSSIQFSIRPAKGWDAATNISAVDSGRSADVYIFCLLKEKDRNLVNPLNLDQWDFFILATEQINQEKGMQKMIGINSLLKMNPIVASYGELGVAVQKVMDRMNEEI